MSNGCALATLANERGIKQGFNYMTEKAVKCNINNEYDSSSAVKRAPKCEKTEGDKRKIKQRKKTALILS